METVFDWISLALFCGIVTGFYDYISRGNTLKIASFVLFIALSTDCAAVNYFGNHKNYIVAACLTGTLCLVISAVIYRLRKLTR